MAKRHGVRHEQVEERAAHLAFENGWGQWSDAPREVRFHFRRCAREVLRLEREVISRDTLRSALLAAMPAIPDEAVSLHQLRCRGVSAYDLWPSVLKELERDGIIASRTIKKFGRLFWRVSEDGS